MTCRLLSTVTESVSSRTPHVIPTLETSNIHSGVKKIKKILHHFTTNRRLLFSLKHLSTAYRSDNGQRSPPNYLHAKFSSTTLKVCNTLGVHDLIESRLSDLLYYKHSISKRERLIPHSPMHGITKNYVSNTPSRVSNQKYFTTAPQM